MLSKSTQVWQGNYLTYIFSIKNPGRRLVQHTQGLFQPQNDRVGFINFKKPLRFAGAGILDSDQQLNPDFYNWNKVYVRYCDGASFSGDAEGQAQALLTGCSAGGLATILHCDDFGARFPRRHDISGERSFWSVYDGVVHLQCFFPAELIKSIHTPMFILNSGYDSWQIRNVLVPVSSAPWLSCKDNIRNCTCSQIEVLDGFRNTMVNEVKVVEDREDWGMFIDSCFTHCQALFHISWNSPISPRLGNKTMAEAVGDWHSGRSRGAKETDCEYPCNPTCSSLLPP